MHIRVDLMKHELPMFHTENDLLQNLVVTSPKSARKKFRESIFESWEWRCMYCDEALTEITATIDHIKPKVKGGHSTRNNMGLCCSKCNSSKDHNWCLITIINLIPVIQKRGLVK